MGVRTGWRSLARMAIAGEAVVLMADPPGERKPHAFRWRQVTSPSLGPAAPAAQETSSFSARRGV